MNRTDIRRRVAESPMAAVVAFPARLRSVSHENLVLARQSAKWLVHSREHTNYTYNLTPRNREHLAWWVSWMTGAGVDEVRGYFIELESDDALRSHIARGTAQSPRRGLADLEVRYGRRIGWYAITRALKPRHVVETGTDKGLGSLVFAAALLRNGTGALTTIDVNPKSGYLITDEYASVVDRRIGDSVALLAELPDIDLLLHDSWHTFEHESAEYQVAPLAENSVVLSDNAQEEDALMRWAELNNRRFAFFAEQPADHWFSGGGIGIALA